MALLNGMMHVIYKNGWHNPAFVEERTENFDALIEMIEKYPPERAAEITGVDASTIIEVAEIYAKSETSSIVYCLGITQHYDGGGQRKKPCQSGHALRPDRKAVYRGEPAARPKQCAGSM